MRKTAIYVFRGVYLLIPKFQLKNKKLKKQEEKHP